MSARRPLAEVLDAQVDERRVQRVWRGVEPRVRGERGRDRRVLVAASVVVAVLVAALASTLRPPVEPPAFLALADGSAPTARAAREAETIAFADGSSVSLAAGAEVVPTRNDRHAIALTLTRGAIDVRVTPGGPRRWRFDCGLAVVEVIGTAFRVERSEAGVRVSVERGHVRVAAQSGRTWDLLAGQGVWVRAPEPVTEAEVPPTQPPPAAPEVSADEATPPARAERSEAPAPTTPRELLLLADVARLSGHPADAVEPLQRLVTEHAEAPEAPLAAVMLGRLQQDALHAPDAAITAFERAQSLGVPAALAADVEGRLALAYLEVGDLRGADLARRYLDEHPEGPHAAALAARLD